MTLTTGGNKAKPLILPSFKDLTQGAIKRDEGPTVESTKYDDSAKATVKKYDTSGDGDLSESELKDVEAFKSLKDKDLALLFADPSGLQTGKPPAFIVSSEALANVIEAIDSKGNNDGKITTVEVTTFLEHLKSKFTDKEGRIDAKAAHKSLHSDKQDSPDKPEESPDKSGGLNWASLLELAPTLLPTLLPLVGGLFNGKQEHSKQSGPIEGPVYTSPMNGVESGPYSMKEYASAPVPPAAPNLYASAPPSGNAWQPYASSLVANTHGFNVMGYGFDAMPQTASSLFANHGQPSVNFQSSSSFKSGGF